MMKWIHVTELDQVAYVKLQRPEVRNAFNPQMIAEITQAFLDFEKRKDLRVIALSGEGKAFCAGADLNWMQEMVNFSLEQNQEDSLKLYAMFEAMEKCSLPVVAHVHGSAFGGALGLIACCDQVVAEKTTQFCFSEVKLGLAPAVISGFVLRKSNIAHVRPLMLSGAVFGAPEAFTAGLVHVLADEAQGHIALQGLIHHYLQGGAEAIRETKKLLNQWPCLIEAQQKEQSCRLISERRVSAEGQEGLRAFLEKREPSWRNP